MFSFLIYRFFLKSLLTIIPHLHSFSNNRRTHYIYIQHCLLLLQDVCQTNNYSSVPRQCLLGYVPNEMHLLSGPERQDFRSL